MSKFSFTGPLYRFVVCFGLPLLVWLGTASFMSIDPSRGDIDLKAGRAAFSDHCAACHVLEPGYTIHHGPNLSAFGKVADERRPDQTAAEYVLESILDPDAFVDPSNRRGMPKNIATELAPDDIRNIIAMLLSRGGSPNYDDIRSLEIPDLRGDPSVQVPVDLEEMLLGEQIVRGKGTCLQCHSVYNNAEYQVFAPGIFAVGLTKRELVEQSIIDPQKVVGAVHRTSTVLLKSGEIVAGKLISQTDDAIILVLRDSRRQLVRREIPLVEIKQEDGRLQIQQSTESAMPTDFDQLLTREEIEAVVNMILHLN